MAKIDAMFQYLMEHKGSDLHLEEGQKPKMRVHGGLRELPGSGVLTEGYLQQLLGEIVDPALWKRFLDIGDLDFAYALGIDARFRANYYRHLHGLGAVFRWIPSNIVQLEALNMPPVLKTFGELQSGLVLVTGPTGSGKSTTMAAILDYVNRNRRKKIITIEEPVEFIHQNRQSVVTHREVGEDTESFAAGLRGAIKSNIDIVLVGEMRDPETIELALTAAQMGILVFGTLHTNSAAKTIDRIIDVFPAAKKNQVRTVLSNTLQAVVSQQLLKSSDGNRRWVACEIMLRTPALAPIIMEGDVAKLATEIQTSRAKGGILMDDCLANLVNAGRVTKEDAFMKALDKFSFMSKLRLAEN